MTDVITENRIIELYRKNKNTNKRNIALIKKDKHLTIIKNSVLYIYLLK